MSSPDAFDAITARIRHSDHSAFEELFTALYTPLLTYLINQFGTPDLAEDAIQAVFIAIWDRRATFHPTAGARAYCFLAARNQMLKLHRTIERSRRREASVAQADDGATTLDSALDESTLRDVIDASLRSIPPRAREIFYLVRQDGLTYAEAANVLGVSVNTVKTQLARVSAALRTALGTTLTILIVAAIS